MRSDGEWKLAFPKRPVAASDGTVLDWRPALPNFMHAVSARLNVISSVYSDWNKSTIVDAELNAYRDHLQLVKLGMASSIGCGFSIWAVGTQIGGFEVRAMCADVNTGTWAMVSKRGMLPSTGFTHCQKALGTTAEDCPKMLWQDGGSDFTRRIGPINISHPDGRRRPIGFEDFQDKKADFLRIAPTTAVFADIMQNGLRDAAAELRRKMGFFEIRACAMRCTGSPTTHLRPMGQKAGSAAASQINASTSTRCSYSGRMAAEWRQATSSFSRLATSRGRGGATVGRIFRRRVKS